MPFTDTAINAAVNGLRTLVTRLGLADASLTEATGGGYARQTIAFNAASSKVSVQSADITFSLAGGFVACFALYRDAGGVDYGYQPLGGISAQQSTILASNDTITSPGHGLANGDRVIFASYGGGSLPSGLAAATLYYVVNSSTGFQVSLTNGGTPVAISSDGEAWFQPIIPFTVPAGGGSTTLPAGTVTIDGSLSPS